MRKMHHWSIFILLLLVWIFLQYFLLTSIRVSFEYYVSKLACVVGNKFLYFIHGSAFGCWWYFCILENCFKLIDTLSPICCSCCCRRYYLLCIVTKFSQIIWSCSCFSRFRLVWHLNGIEKRCRGVR